MNFNAYIKNVCKEAFLLCFFIPFSEVMKLHKINVIFQEKSLQFLHRIFFSKLLYYHVKAGKNFPVITVKGRIRGGL